MTKFINFKRQLLIKMEKFLKEIRELQKLCQNYSLLKRKQKILKQNTMRSLKSLMMKNLIYRCKMTNSVNNYLKSKLKPLSK